MYLYRRYAIPLVLLLVLVELVNNGFGTWADAVQGIVIGVALGLVKILIDSRRRRLSQPGPVGAGGFTGRGGDAQTIKRELDEELGETPGTYVELPNNRRWVN